MPFSSPSSSQCRAEHPCRESQIGLWAVAQLKPLERAGNAIASLRGMPRLPKLPPIARSQIPSSMLTEPDKMKLAPKIALIGQQFQKSSCFNKINRNTLPRLTTKGKIIFTKSIALIDQQFEISSCFNKINRNALPLLKVKDVRFNSVKCVPQ
jgi:hypothetical protein